MMNPYNNNPYQSYPEQNYYSPAYNYPLQNSYAPGYEMPREKSRKKYKATEIALIAISLVIMASLLILVFSVLSLSVSLASISAQEIKNISSPANSFAVIKIEGAIQSTTANTAESYNHKATLEFIRNLADDTANKGILMYMDTGGGGVFESDEIYRALEQYKEKTKRPIWVYMHQTCASGGYYISMAAEKIYANYSATTGSIGVYISLNDLSGLYDKLGVESVLIRSGANKGAGVPGTHLTEEQRAIYQGIVDEEYEHFLSLVVSGRKMEEGKARKLADGRPYTAAQALENGLVDELADYNAVEKAFKEKTGADPFTPALQGRNAFSGIVAEIAGIMPRSDLDVALETAENMRGGVPMAWQPGLAYAG